MFRFNRMWRDIIRMRQKCIFWRLYDDDDDDDFVLAESGHLSRIFKNIFYDYMESSFIENAKTSCFSVRFPMAEDTK